MLKQETSLAEGFGLGGCQVEGPRAPSPRGRSVLLWADTALARNPD